MSPPSEPAVASTPGPAGGMASAASGETPLRGADGPLDGPLDVGARIQVVRRARRLTLSAAAAECGIGRSTLAKIEAGQMSPTIDLLQKVARGLRVEITELLRSESGPAAAGRLAVTKAGEGERHETPAHLHEMLCSTLASKRMLPFRSRIKARAGGELPPFNRHDGEEMIVVLEGTVVLHSEFYSPTVLGAGDTAYLDARMGHCFVPEGDKDALVLFVITG